MKAQSSMEFLILIGAVLFVLSGFLLVIQKSLADKTEERIDLKVEEIAISVQKEIDFAFRSTDGYKREFTLPLQIEHLGYNVSIIDDSVYVVTEDQKHALSFLVRNVSGQPYPGSNVIRKNDGLVYLNQ